MFIGISTKTKGVVPNTLWWVQLLSTRSRWASVHGRYHYTAGLDEAAGKGAGGVAIRTLLAVGVRRLAWTRKQIDEVAGVDSRDKQPATRVGLRPDSDEPLVRPISPRLSSIYSVFLLNSYF